VTQPPAPPDPLQPDLPSPPTASPRPEPLVRGFLFADLRGYTAFVERAGDAAAAELLERYRGLVRGVVAEQAGAEIRTEGDSFYVVFPSPSAAVRAGLALVERAAADATDHPSDPIVVGVGIHAGESAETGEGYVGSAVNLAARICSVARSGEVLVSATVRSLARTSLPVSYASRGRPALKGVSEPVELFAVTPATGAPGIPAPSASRLAPPASTRARAGLVGLGAGVVVLAVVGIAALSGGPGGSGGPSPSPSAGASGGVVGSGDPTASAGASGAASGSPGPAAFKTGPLDAGTYRTTRFQPGLTFTLPDGWTGLDEMANWFVLGPTDDPTRASSELFPFRIGERVTVMRPSVGLSPCVAFTIPLTGEFHRPPGAMTVELPRGREGLAGWARSNPTLIMGEPEAGSIGAFDSIRYDVALSQSCGLPPTQRVEIFSFLEHSIAPKNYVMHSVDGTSWHLLEIDGQALVIAIESPGDHEAFERRARSILSTLRPTQ
jgi:class 3 adenylate cyclase